MTAREPHIGRPKRVLIVDDDPANLYYAGKVLRLHGYDITSARAYYDALKALAEAPVHLLVADIKLDKGSGLALARLAKSAQPDLPVLLMTVYRDAEISARDAGLPVMRLPFSSRSFLTRVRQLI